MKDAFGRRFVQLAGLLQAVATCLWASTAFLCDCKQLWSPVLEWYHTFMIQRLRTVSPSAHTP